MFTSSPSASTMTRSPSSSNRRCVDFDEDAVGKSTWPPPPKIGADALPSTASKLSFAAKVMVPNVSESAQRDALRQAVAMRTRDGPAARLTRVRSCAAWRRQPARSELDRRREV